MTTAFETTERLEGLRTSQPRRRSHTGLIIGFGILFLVVILALASFFAARWYYQDKAAPGVSIGNHTVTGQNAEQLTATVKQVVDDSAINVKDPDGHTIKASLEQLGVKVDVDKTVQNLLNAKQQNVFARVSPFSVSKVALQTTRDPLTLSTFLTDQFVSESERAVPSGIGFDAGKNTFTATQGKDGRAPITQPVDQALDSALAEPGAARTVSIEYRDVKAPISYETAQQAAKDANIRLASTITIGNGSAKHVTIPAARIASWIKPAADPSKGTITLNYDTQAIKDYIVKELPGELTQKKVDQQDVVDTQGKVLLTKAKGVDGVTIGDTSSVANDVVNAVTNGTPADLTAPASVTPFAVNQTVAHMRIVVDRSKQIATVYQDDQVVKTFNVCTGRSGQTESDLGTFAIYLRYNTQTMRGSNVDGTRYVTPNVRWVSYYNGGEGFHAAPWNTKGITTGNPQNNGSHGCINMKMDDAKWIFDNAPMGTIVQVVGTQPNGPVRDANGTQLNG